jgi:hypothetical protein
MNRYKLITNHWFVSVETPKKLRCFLHRHLRGGENQFLLVINGTLGRVRTHLVLFSALVRNGHLGCPLIFRLNSGRGTATSLFSGGLRSGTATLGIELRAHSACLFMARTGPTAMSAVRSLTGVDRT